VVTGWCADPDDARLRAALDARNLHYCCAARGTEDTIPPSVLRNPAWHDPSRFRRLMGVPGTREADPSVVVAFVRH